MAYSIEGHVIDRNTGQNGRGWAEGYAHTLNATDRHGVVYPEKARTLTARMDASPCVDRGQEVVVQTYTPEGNHCGAYREDETSATLQTRYHYGGGGDAALVIENHPDDSRVDFAKDNVVPTLIARMGTGGGNVPMILEKTVTYIQPAFGDFRESDVATTLKASDGKRVDPGACVLEKRRAIRKYIVRRLTPLECCRLQGFPDWWCDGVEGSDSAQYRLWGNGIALPCAFDVLERIARAGGSDESADL